MTTAAPALKEQPRTLGQLTPTDEEMVISCARYQYVTVDQCCRYFEDDGKRRYLQRRSRALAMQDYLSRLYIARPGGGGKAPSLFTPGQAGRRHAASLGLR